MEVCRRSSRPYLYDLIGRQKQSAPSNPNSAQFLAGFPPSGGAGPVAGGLQLPITGQVGKQLFAEVHSLLFGFIALFKMVDSLMF